jgi:DNA-binding beta-propeller fold protein YncE
VQSLAVVATIPVGRGMHQIAFDANGARAFVSNGLDSTLSVVDVATMKKIADSKRSAATPAGR